MKNFREGVKENLNVLRGNLGVLVFSASLWAVAGTLVGPFFSLYILGLGGSYFDIGLVSAVGSLCGIAPTLIAGHLADAVGRRKLFLPMNFLASFSYIILSQAPSWHFILIGHALESLFFGFRGPAFSALVADSTKPKRRALAYALWMRIPQTVAIASPYIAGVFIDKYAVVVAMRWFYAFTFIMSFTASMIRYKFVKETLSGPSSPSNGVLNGLKSSLRFLVKPEKGISRQVFVIFAVSIILNLGFAVTGNYWITYAVEDVIGLTATEWGFITLVQGGVLTGFAIISAVISDKYGRVKVIALSLVLTPITIILFPYCQAFNQVLTLLVIKSVLEGFRVASFSAILTDYSPRGYRGRIEANLRLVSNVSTMVGSLWGGYIYQNYFKALPFTVNALIIGITAALFILKVKEPTEREE